VAIELVKFNDKDIQQLLTNVDQKKIDAMAFGAVELDATGKILSYNMAEGQIVGRKPTDVIGKNFFDEVAPCTKSPEFYGLFTEIVRTNRDTFDKFQFVFDYKMQPTKVSVMMARSVTKTNGAYTYWVFVKRM
jgi:photoactive yellow protein